jgi:Domain of Unknown Function (DUF1259)
MKCQSFPWFTASGTTSLCAVLFFCCSAVGLAAESGVDTVKIESITGLKGVLNEKSFGLSQLPEKSSIEGEAISQVFAQKGDAKDGMYKVTIGRETKMACGCTVGNTMGINTWAAFAGTCEDALVVGDFVMLETELQMVLKTLRGNGINIVAIHQHMIGENPRTIFLHYHGRGKALALAQAVKAAISTQPIAANRERISGHSHSRFTQKFAAIIRAGDSEEMC